MPKCEKPGCGREMIHCCGETAITHKNYPCPIDKGRARWKCGATPDQHRIAELEANLAEADSMLVATQCPRHLNGGLLEQWMRIRKAALCRQAQRGKEG